jgi:hypothetical protein
VSIRLFDGVDPDIGTEVPTHRMSDCIGNLSADYNNEVRRSSAHRRPDITIPARSQNRFIGRSPSKPIAGAIERCNARINQPDARTAHFVQELELVCDASRGLRFPGFQ